MQKSYWKIFSIKYETFGILVDVNDRVKSDFDPVSSENDRVNLENVLLNIIMKKIVLIMPLFCLFIVHGCKSEPAPIGENSYLLDIRDGKKYRIVRIGNKIWMAENLNHRTFNSWCYDDKRANCKKYGRLYKWNAARVACPLGWRLPTRQEWDDLVVAAGGSSKLRSKTGWFIANGTDDYGFSALPNSLRYCDGYYETDVKNISGRWWTGTKGDYGRIYYRTMWASSEEMSESQERKCKGYSVRCVK